MNQLVPPQSFQPTAATTTFAPQQHHQQYQQQQQSQTQTQTQTPPTPSSAAVTTASGQQFAGVGAGGAYYHPQPPPQPQPQPTFQPQQYPPLHDHGGTHQHQAYLSHLPPDHHQQQHQQQQQQSYHEYGNTQQRSSSAEQPGGNVMQQHHHFPHTHFNNNANPYTNAPYSQSIPAHVPTSATTAPPQHADLRHSASASPHNRFSPHAGFQPPPPQQQQQQQHHYHSQQTSPAPAKYPMAAPPLPQTPSMTSQPQLTSNPTPPAGIDSPSTPQYQPQPQPQPHQPHQPQQQQPHAQSPTTPNPPPNLPTSHLETRRITLLLQINHHLISEISRLQTLGEGGVINPQQLSAQKASGGPDKVASEDYIQCLRRVQANLAYLAPRADARMDAKTPPGPAHMTAPAQLLEGEVGRLYAELAELFPGWTGLDGKGGTGRPNGLGGGSRTNSSGGGTPAA